ncbi:MAG: class I SAM-dependent methyltransferase, partial [Candidatus Caldatribacteriota bacterium]|nr:class I SAM-dependent methyltransferase [Candidatus Caldatribacteriota bacterium]
MKLGKMEKRAMISQKHAKHGIEHVERLLRYVSLKGNQSYLEVGCGNGHVCKHLARKYHWKITGTDVDPEMIKFAKEDIDDIPHIRFFEINATKMPFKDNEFDIVLSFGVMHHIGDWERALEEISRVLKPQGFFIFGELAYSRFTTTIFRPLVKNYGVYTIDDLTHCLRRNNFEIIFKEEPKGIIMKYYS